MNPTTIQLSPIHVAMIRHTGPYELIESKFNQLWEWVEANGVPASRTIGLYWDNPEFVPAPQLRSAACVEIPFNFQLPIGGRLPIEVKDIAGGTYITHRHVGPYEQLAHVWLNLTYHVESVMKHTISENPDFEIYVNDPSDTPSHQLITDLYVPIV